MTSESDEQSIHKMGVLRAVAGMRGTDSHTKYWKFYGVTAKKCEKKYIPAKFALYKLRVNV